MRKRIVVFFILGLFLFINTGFLYSGGNKDVIEVVAFNLSPQAKKVENLIKSYVKKFSGKKDILVTVIEDKNIAELDKSFAKDWKGWRFIVVELKEGNKRQEINLLSNGKYIIRFIEKPGLPLNFIDVLKMKNKKYNVAVNNIDYVFGNKDAKNRIIIFGDFQCPYCKLALMNILDTFKDRNDIVVYFKNFPLSFHQYAKSLTKIWIAGKMAGIDGRKLIYAIEQIDLMKIEKELGKKKKVQKQEGDKDREQLVLKEFEEKIGDKIYAKIVKVMVTKSKDIEKVLNKEIEEGQNLGIVATPTVFVNGYKVEGYNYLLIDYILNNK